MRVWIVQVAEGRHEVVDDRRDGDVFFLVTLSLLIFLLGRCRCLFLQDAGDLRWLGVPPVLLDEVDELPPLPVVEAH